MSSCGIAMLELAWTLVTLKDLKEVKYKTLVDVLTKHFAPQSMGMAWLLAFHNCQWSCTRPLPHISLSYEFWPTSVSSLPSTMSCWTSSHLARKTSI